MLLKKIISLFLATIFMLGAAGCAGDNKRENNDNAIDPVGQIIITGSPTLGQVLTQLILEFTDEYGTWNRVDPLFPNEPIDIVINGGGSTAGVLAIIDKTASFGLISRNVSEDEKTKLDRFGQSQLGVDALTISVNPHNPILEIQQDLSQDELIKLFSGEFTHWDDLNPALPHEEIVLVTRDIGGGAHEVFQQTIMSEIEVSLNTIQAPSMGALVTKIIDNERAIGYASFGVVNQHEGAIIPLSVQGVTPTKEHILSGDYAISRPILILYNGLLKPQEQALLDLFLSDQGMRIIEARGFIPIR